MVVGLLVGFGLLTGCGKKTKTKKPVAPKAWTDAVAKPSGKPWGGTLQVTLGDWKALQKIIDSHKGKVVVAGFFTTWDEENVFQIRHIARLQSRFPEKILCVLVSSDFNDESVKPEALRPMLATLVKEWIGTELPGDATLRLFISTEEDVEFNRNANTIDAVPTVFVYDQSGKRTKIFLGGEKGIDYGLHVLPVVEEMLK